MRPDRFDPAAAAEVIQAVRRACDCASRAASLAEAHSAAHRLAAVLSEAEPCLRSGRPREALLRDVAEWEAGLP